MDPTNQPPGQPTPPWGTDPQPEAPKPGQPPSPWGTDPQPEAPQPGQPLSPWAAPGEPTPPWAVAGQPEAPQPGGPTPQWAIPGQTGAPQPYVPGQPWPQVPQKSGGKGKRVVISALVFVAVIVALVAFNALRGSNDGKVLFSTDVPTADQKCNPSGVVTTAAAATSVYATYEYTGRMGSDQVTLTITKDDTAYGAPVILSVSDTSGTDCGYDITDLSSLPDWGAGKWKFTLTAAGKTVSEGTITVTP